LVDEFNKVQEDTPPDHLRKLWYSAAPQEVL
jgi:hypothetical protein